MLPDSLKLRNNHSEAKLLLISSYEAIVFRIPGYKFKYKGNFHEICPYKFYGMSALYELLKYTVPSLVVLATAYYLLKMFLDKETEKTQMQMRLDVQKVSLPIRMQAYERLVLLLERIEPAGLLVRTNLPGMNASQLQSALIQTIRSEFEHNLSQQLYVSTKVWEMVRNAREETIKRINTSAMKLTPEATSTDLASLILIDDIDAEQSAVKGALDLLKSEARNNFF